MEPTARPSRTTDTREFPNHSKPDAVASSEPLSSWEGTGTAYALPSFAAKPTPAAPRPVAPRLKSATSDDIPDIFLPPLIADADASLLEPLAERAVNWPLLAGVVVGLLITALAVGMALWKSATDEAPTASRAEATGVPPAKPELVEEEPLVIPPSEPVPDEPSAEDAESAASDLAVVPPAEQSDVQAAPAEQPTPQPAPELPAPKPVAVPTAAPTPAQPVAPVEEHPAQHIPQVPAPAAVLPRKKAPATSPAMTVTARKVEKPLRRQSPKTPPVAVQSGTLIVAVKPWGEVWVDGTKRGISPPLFKLELPTGPHQVELRNPGLPSLTQKLQISPGQSVTLQHSFH